MRFLLKLVVQSLNHVHLFAASSTVACQVPLSSTISQSLLKFMSIELGMLSNHFILCCCLLLLPSTFPSIRFFSNESALPIRWPKYWSFSYGISPSKVHSGLNSFRIGWFGFFVVQKLLRVFSSTTIRKHQFFSTQPSLSSKSMFVHDYWKKHSFDYMGLCQQSDVWAF